MEINWEKKPGFLRVVSYICDVKIDAKDVLMQGTLHSLSVLYPYRLSARHSIDHIWLASDDIQDEVSLSRTATILIRDCWRWKKKSIDRKHNIRKLYRQNRKCRWLVK